ncbi:MAG: hypothetical protein H6698_05345 [Myxococcales bacterium]|nr:hypothetical protein [Myxococcales bacterium]MCB9530214.1 hypothetical protein [Myxococcales bacterium]MCB9533727.1 hypothetical protein [Myxococcales bacterium]
MQARPALPDATVRLQGLQIGRHDLTSADRRAAILAASHADLVDAFCDAASSADPALVEPLARQVGLPVGEVAASYFGLRSIALAALEGAAVAHHEVRAAVAWPSELAGGDEVDDADAQWDRGVFRFAKYRAFLQDEPFAGFNPDHMAKWGPHELLHRAAGFFWRDDASSWEHYLGARLNELVPVVVWYGLDEVARLDRVGFDRALDADDRLVAPERALWLAGPTPLRTAAAASIEHLRTAIVHFERELAAIDRELATGLQVSIPTNGLDASSDAIAYVVGHGPRLASARFAALADHVLVPNEQAMDSGVCTSLRRYRDRVEALFDRLVFGDIELDLRVARARMQARVVWDVAQRAVHADRANIVRLSPALAAAGLAVAQAWAGDATPAASAAAGVLAALPAATSKVVAALGIPPGVARDTLGDAATASPEQLAEGVASVAPATLAALERVAPDWVAHAVSADALWARAPLATRLGPLLPDDVAIRSLWKLETAIARCVARDDASERLGAEPVWPAEGARLARSSAFEVIDLVADPVAMHAAWAEGDGIDPSLLGRPASYLVGAWFDGVSLVPCPPIVRQLLDELGADSVDADLAAARLDAVGASEGGEDWPHDGVAWVEELVAAGALRWVPAIS